MIQTEVDHIRMPRQNRMNRATQIPDAFAMDNADLNNPVFAASRQVIDDQLLHLPGIERVQVQYPIDRKLNWFIHRQLNLLACRELSSALSGRATDGG